jgi:hypothetical protein
MEKSTSLIRSLVITGLILVLGAGIWWRFGAGANNAAVAPLNTTQEQQAGAATGSANTSNANTASQSDTNSDNLPPKVLQSVIFTAQAPGGNWSDPREQDGCEEASILMAAKWAKGETTWGSGEALNQILALSHKAEDMFGTYHDSSAADTLKLYKAYFGLNGTVKYNVTAEDMKKELASGHVIVVPANGQKLGNSNFTAPGPDRHALIVIGYDDNAKVFITNDPGTRNGKGYRYAYTTLLNAMVDYPTGDHAALFSTNKNAAIIMNKA